MDIGNAFQTLGISLGLGLLVGFQRERVDAPLAGVRTFALITLLGTLTGFLAQALGPWVVAIGLLAVAITVSVGNVLTYQQGRLHTGITTEVAILLMFVTGAYLVFGHRPVAVVVGAGTAVLLHAKPILHGFVKRLGETEVRVVMQFVLISLVILPVLPDRTYGPFDVLNPREIWWMVVLVVGISLVGYIALKLYGQKTGLILAGLIGGMISSTATTVSQASRASREKGHLPAATLVILLASTVVYARVLLEVFVAARAAFVQVAPPIAILLAASVLLCVAQWRLTRDERTDLESQRNPTELRTALAFAALYAVVLLAVATARHYLGDRGVYIAAGISGLTDMDAITLTTSRLVAHGVLPAEVLWRSIVIALISNLAFKGAVVWVVGGAALGRRVLGWFALEIALALGLLIGWPA